MLAVDSSQTSTESGADGVRHSYSDDVLAAVDSGRTIEAIKWLRAETGVGLKEAKHAIDALARERQENPAAAANLPQAGGAGSVIKIVILIGVVLAAYFYFFAP